MIGTLIVHACAGYRARDCAGEWGLYAELYGQHGLQQLTGHLVRPLPTGTRRRGLAGTAANIVDTFWVVRF